MTLKGRRGLIDALLYLKISGSLVVASAEVSACVCACVRERGTERESTVHAPPLIRMCGV